MNRSRTTGALHTPGALRPGRKVRGQNRAGAHGSCAWKATTTPPSKVSAMRRRENDKSVSQSSHSTATRDVFADGDDENGATVQKVENSETVSHLSPSRLEIADGAGDSHIPTVTGCCGGVSFGDSNSRSKTRSKAFAVPAIRAGCEERKIEQSTPAFPFFTREFFCTAGGRAAHEVGKVTLHPFQGGVKAHSGKPSFTSRKTGTKRIEVNHGFLSVNGCLLGNSGVGDESGE